MLFFGLLACLRLGYKAQRLLRDASTRTLSRHSIGEIQEAGRDNLFTTMANNLRTIGWDRKNQQKQTFS